MKLTCEVDLSELLELRPVHVQPELPRAEGPPVISYRREAGNVDLRVRTCCTPVRQRRRHHRACQSTGRAIGWYLTKLEAMKGETQQERQEHQTHHPKVGELRLAQTLDVGVERAWSEAWAMFMAKTGGAILGRRCRTCGGGARGLVARDEMSTWDLR